MNKLTLEEGNFWFVPNREQIFDDLEENFAQYRVTQPIIRAISEYVGLKKKLFRRFLGKDPSTNSLFVDGLNRKSRQVKEGAASWRALDVIYNYDSETEDAVTNFWFGFPNAQAVRNRLKISKRLLKAALIKRRQETGRGSEADPLRLYSIAAGSAQGVIETVAELKRENIHVSVFLLDKDMYAHEIVKHHARVNDVEDSIGFYSERAQRLRKYCAPGHADVIEMLGLLDYLPNKVAVWLCHEIHTALAPGGVFMTCHIHNNPGMSFLKHVLNWGEDPKMLYRSKEELGWIVCQAGFKQCELFTEPHKIHTIALCIKE